MAIGRHTGKVNDVEIELEQKPIDNLDTVTLYLNANNQKPYYNYIFSQHPKRIIFNPGAENQELAALAKENRYCSAGSLHVGFTKHGPVLIRFF